MKLYLTSYKLGNDVDGFKKLVGKIDAKIAVIDNSRDCYNDEIRRATGLKEEFESLKTIGFFPEHVDLRDYFENNDALFEKLKQFDVVWVLGGNSFVLMKAMRQSGFDRVVEELIKTNKLVYAGYSAALCVISPTLDGVELVDDVNAVVEGYDNKPIWDG